MIIVDLGTILLLFFVLLLGGIFAGTAILEPVIRFLFGPFKIGAIILIILTILVNVVFAFNEESTFGGLPSRIIGTVCNVFGGTLRCVINVIFFLCVMLGFLQNMELGGWHILWAAFAILSDGLVFLLLFSGSMFIDGMALSYADRIPMFLTGMANVILSVIYFMIAQGLLIGFYKSTVLELFANQAWVSDFVLNSWFLMLIGY